MCLNFVVVGLCRNLPFTRVFDHDVIAVTKNRPSTMALYALGGFIAVICCNQFKPVIPYCLKFNMGVAPNDWRPQNE